MAAIFWGYRLSISLESGPGKKYASMAVTQARILVMDDEKHVVDIIR